MIQNTETVRLDFLFWSFTWPLWLLTMASAVLGELVWFGLGVMRVTIAARNAVKTVGTESFRSPRWTTIARRTRPKVPEGGRRMGCLLVLLAAFAPRLIVVFAWIARPAYFGAVFDTWIFPLLGLIFLPFTTLIWLLVGAPPQGVEGFDWVWVVLAVLLDLSHYANTYEQRDTVSAGMGRNPTPPTATPPTNR
jgi:hypothetical protein